MPRISQFFGILIYMYYNNHMPPHFHAKWAEYEAIVLICTSSIRSSVYTGNLPKSQLDLVLKWAQHDTGRHLRLMLIGADESAMGAINRPLLMSGLFC